MKNEGLSHRFFFIQKLMEQAELYLKTLHEFLEYTTFKWGQYISQQTWFSHIVT